MATQFTNEQGRQLVGCLAFCLRADGPRRLLEWFNFTGPEKEALLKMLKSLFGEEIEIDLPGLRKMVQTFMDLTDPATVPDRYRISWEAVANGKSKIQQLELNVTGRRIWYESLREEGDTEWKEDGKPPPVDEQFYLTKLRKVGKLTLEYLKTLEDRWKKGEKMLELYKSFMKIANTTGPGQTILNLQLKDITVGEVVATIKKGNKEANEWADEISAYFNVPIAGKFQEAMKFFFSGSGCEADDSIDWGKLKKRLEDGDITALKMVSEEIKPANEMTEVNSTLNILGETMLRVNSLGEEPVETEKERKENQRRKDVREGFKEKYERWYHIIVAAYIADGEVGKLKASKTKLIKYGEIVKSLAGTWADIRNFDSDFAEVRKLKYHADEIEKDIEVEDGLIEMSERIREAEEELKEERKAKEDLQKQDVKRSEAMMKKENMVTYEGKASFLEWAGTITKLLEQLPESTADVIICSFVKTTINHKETFNLIQNCKTTEEIMKIMGELHATDKSVVIEAFAPVKQLKKPTTYSIAFHNGQVILRTADTLISIGIEEAIELNELDLCVDKAIHDARYQAWLEYSHTELKKLAAADAEGHPVEKTKLEEKGKYDITHSIQSFNKGRSLARNFHLLCKWIKEDMSLVQDAKDREERTHNRGHSSQRGGGNATGSYFVQQNPGNPNAFGGNRGGRQAPGGYRRPYGTNGGAPQGQRFPGGGQGRPNKHPDCQVALERWRTLKGVGAEAKPMTKDCPLKCSHAIPFGNAGWCATFRKYEPSMKLDVVKKNGLCRRCLSNWGPPHSPKDCRAPACSKCKGDHNALICPSPSGSVQIHATGFVDIYKDRDVFDDLDPQIMMLTVDEGEQGILGGSEEEIGQYYVGETVIEEYTEDDIIFEDPDEPVNHFCINFVEDTLQCNAIGRWSQSQGTSTDNGDREVTMPGVERICSKEAMGELKSDDTKPTGQKVGGGHLMTEAADSLRTNAGSESNIKSGHKNTEGTTICKVNTIRQADQNSEPLCSEKPVQETGSKDLTGGKSECENRVEIKANDTKKEKEATSPTMPEKVRSGADQDERNEVEVIGEQLLEDRNTEAIRSMKGDRPARYQIKEELTMTTNGICTEYDMKEQRYTCYRENIDYHPLNRKTAKNKLEKELYTRMVKAAVRINKIFPSIRGITDAVCVMGKMGQPTPEMLKNEKGTWVTCLFDSGAEIGTHTKTLEMAVELEKLEEKPMILNTVNGAVKKIYDIKKIKLVTEENQQQSGEVYTLSSAQVDHIGIEKGHMQAYVNVIAFLLQMTPKLRKHFIKQCNNDKKEIQLILGQKGGSMLMHEVIPEQLGLRQHWLLPNLTIFRSSLTQNLLLAGELGIDGKLVDEDYPTLYPTKQQFEELKRKLGDGEDISDDLGENLMAKQFVPNEHNNSAYYRQEVESSARSSEIRTNNEVYAEEVHNSQQEKQGLGREARVSNILKGIWEEENNNYKGDPNCKENVELNKSIAAKQDKENIVHYTGYKATEESIDSETDTRGTGECKKCKQRSCQDCEVLTNAYKAQDTDLHEQDLNITEKQIIYTLEEARKRANPLTHEAKIRGNTEILKEEIARKIEQGTLWESHKEEWRGVLKGTYYLDYLTENGTENSQSPRLSLLQDRMRTGKRERHPSLRIDGKLMAASEDWVNRISNQIRGYAPEMTQCYQDLMKENQTPILMSCHWDKYTETGLMRATHINPSIKFGDAMGTLVLRLIQANITIETRGLDLAKRPLHNSISGDNDSTCPEQIEGHFKAIEETHKPCNNPEGHLKGDRSSIVSNEGTLKDLAKENEESPTDTLLDTKGKPENTDAQEVQKLVGTTVTDFAEPLFPWELTRRVISNMVTEACSRLGSIWIPAITNLKKWVTRGLQTINVQSTAENGIEMGPELEIMTNELGNHNEATGKQEDEGVSERNRKTYIRSKEIDKGKGKINMSPSPRNLKATDKVTPAYPITSKRLGTTNLFNKGATDGMRQREKGILTPPGVTAQPKGSLMIKGEGHASNYRIDTRCETWTPYFEKLGRIPGKAEDKMESSNRARTLVSNTIEEHNGMKTICTMETRQDTEEHKRLAAKLEAQVSGTGMPCKTRGKYKIREHGIQSSKTIEEESIIEKDDQREEAEKHYELKSKGDRTRDTWETVPSEHTQPRCRPTRKVDGKKIKGQNTVQKGVIMTPSALEIIDVGDSANGEWKEVTVESPMSDGIRKGLMEHSQVINRAKEKARKEKFLGEIDDWVWIETSGSTRKEIHEERVEAHSKGSATVHVKNRDMNMGSNCGTESPR